ncbi:TonB-dependent receptor [Flammeovirga aprica]|uniref:TonB-dependent receptor n=1 Tax=Flammeovirga aprica JL-4 TaxID=694437 RepID=A0A7X9RU52_9BACT|nr:TonB-dependent receptor [Flammeovirga aprica]NME68597.1 TonB-dependent receptor [Flammeovirga aprica JL-4]
MKKLTILLPFLFCLSAYSQNDTLQILQSADTITLEEIVIQAYRANTTTPVTYKNVTKEDIELINSGQEPSVILSSTPSINSYSDAGNYQGYSYFRLRGIDQTRINMTLDGIPLNEPEDQGVYFSNYPDFFNSIQSLQIQRGVGTSTNGVASYAGSINFQSPNLTDDYYSKIGINYGSFNTYRVFGEYNNGLKNDQGFYARVSHLHSDGYKYRSANTSNSAFLSYGLFKENHRLKFTGFIGNQKNQLAWIGVPMEVIVQDPRTNGNADENDAFLQALASVQHSWNLSENVVLNNTAYYNFLDGNYDFDLNNFLGFPSTDEMYNYDFRHNFMGYFSNINWDAGNLNLNAGIHFNTYNRRHIGSERTLGELYENTGFKNEFSTFVKASYTLNRFVLFGDLQYRYADFDYSGSVPFEKQQWHFINPKVGINYFISDKANVYYSFGVSGREPTRNDLFNGEDDLPADELGNPLYNDVNPEQVENHELGTRLTFNKLQLTANVYYMNFTNEIVLNGQYGPNGLPLHSNVAQSFRSGIEVDLKWEFMPHFYYQNSSSYSYNQITEEDVSFSPILTPNLIINQTLGYQKKGLHIGTNIKYQSESYIDFSNENTTPSFYSVDIFGQYRYKSLDFKVAFNNIMNEQIIANGYIGIDGTPLYFVQAPINFTGGVTWNF